MDGGLCGYAVKAIALTDGLYTISKASDAARRRHPRGLLPAALTQHRMHDQALIRADRRWNGFVVADLVARVIAKYCVQRDITGPSMLESQANEDPGRTALRFIPVGQTQEPT